MDAAISSKEADERTQAHHNEDTLADNEKPQPGDANLAYNDVDEEPELHLRTYIAVAAMLLLNYVQVIALQGPPVVVRAQDPSNAFSQAILTEHAVR
jgi:hypothetical protein